MSARIGFIGLGSQGRPIAAHFAPGGFETTVFDLAPEPMAELVATGARAAHSTQEVGKASDLVGICVPEDEHVRSVVLGSGGADEGLLAGLSEGGIVLIHSTVLPSTIEEVARAGAAKGVEVLDACVTGGTIRASERQLTYLVGGAKSTFDKARVYFDATTDVEPIHAGELGFGAKLKICVNLVTYIQFAAAFESMVLAKAIGLPQEILEQATQSNGQLTGIMRAFLGTHKAPEEVRMSDDFQRFMRSNQQIAEKDLACALTLAREESVALPVGDLVSKSMSKLYGVLESLPAKRRG